MFWFILYVIANLVVFYFGVKAVYGDFDKYYKNSCVANGKQVGEISYSLFVGFTGLIASLLLIPIILAYYLYKLLR